MSNLSLKSIFVWLFILCLIPILMYGAVAVYIGRQVYQQPTHKADAIIVLGARTKFGDKVNPCLASRTDEAARLMNKNEAKFVIVSGGKEPNGNTESDFMAQLMIDQGVSKDHIILESKATSTYENLVYSKTKMKSQNLKTAIIVTEPFHIPRADLIADNLGIDHQMSSANSSPCWSRWKWASRYFLREPLVLIVYKLQGKI